MSLGNDLLEMGYKAQMPVYGELMAMIVSGDTFRGIIEPMPAIEADMPLGQDLRELSVLHLHRDEVPDELDDASTPLGLRFTQGDNTWEIVKREDNPADFISKFWIVKVTTADA